MSENNSSRYSLYVKGKEVGIITIASLARIHSRICVINIARNLQVPSVSQTTFPGIYKEQSSNRINKTRLYCKFANVRSLRDNMV